MQQWPGGPLVALSNYYSGLYGPVGSAEAVHGLLAAQWQAAAQALRRLPGSAVLRLQPLDAASNWLPALEAGLRTAGYWTSRYFAFGNWCQPVPAGGFAPYWADRPSALRHSVERGRRRLEKAGTWRIDIVTSGAPVDTAALDTALAAYQAVYAQSWKQPEPCPDFMPSLVRLAARKGWLRLGVLWLNDQPLASQVWLVFGAKANIYKLAYVKGQDRLSAGSVLTAALMQHAMDVDKVQEVDYPPTRPTGWPCGASVSGWWRLTASACPDFGAPGGTRWGLRRNALWIEGGGAEYQARYAERNEKRELLGNPLFVTDYLAKGTDALSLDGFTSLRFCGGWHPGPARQRPAVRGWSAREPGNCLR